MGTITRSVLTRAGVAELAAVPPETSRFYKRKGSLKPPGRNATGYRLYGREDLQRLQFVIGFKRLGLSLRDIREFLQRVKAYPIADFLSDGRSPKTKGGNLS